MIRWLQDFWRGFSDADIESMRHKLGASRRAGEATYLTRRELRAMTSEFPDGRV